MHTHTEVVEDNRGKLAGCLETRCGQLGGLLRERGEVVCPLEAVYDQVGPVELSGVEGVSAANGCTESLGGMEAPGALEVTRIPSVIVPVCVVKGVSAPTCVDETPGTSETPCMSETPRVSVTACVSGMVRVSEARCVRETACVRSLYEREMTVGMREHAAASPGVNVMEWCLSVMTRRCAWVEWRRRRRRQTKDKGRVAAVAISGTVPGWHSSEREVRTVPGTRPPRARLRE